MPCRLVEVSDFPKSCSAFILWVSSERPDPEDEGIILLIMKANEMHYFSYLFDKYSTCFGHVHCLTSGVSQHCTHAVGVWHSSSVGICVFVISSVGVC
jgi:hypothetical protein